MVQKTEWRMLQECRNAIDSKMHWWFGWVDRLGDGYKIAYDNHKKTVNEWKKQKELQFDIACSVLGLMSWGATKWIGISVEAKAAATGKTWLKDWAWEPAVEVGKTLGGHAGNQLKKSAGGASGPVAKDPALFRSQLRTAINMACGSVKTKIDEVQKVADNKRPLPPQRVRGIEKRMLDTWFMTVTQQSVPSKETVKKEIAPKMEALMWALWAPKGLYDPGTSKRSPGELMRPSAPHAPAHYEEAPTVILERLTKTLKVKLGFEDKWLRSEAKHFQEWARKYRSKSWKGNRAFGYDLPKHIKTKWRI